MSVNDLREARDAYLASYDLPSPRFEPTAGLGEPVKSVWDALHSRAFARAAARSMEEVAASSAHSIDVRAALYAATAFAAQGMGNNKRALAAAEKSILLIPHQWLAHRAIVQAYWSTGEFENGYFYLSTLLEPETEFAWDEPLVSCERHTAIAAMAWRLNDWDGVHDHLSRAYPGGPTTMSIPLRDDAFRVAVYRDCADDAAAAAETLLDEYAIEDIDTMLRTMDARGWADRALDLYRKAYRGHRDSELLRRRLVGLCVREGRVEEARALTEGNALDLAA